MGESDERNEMETETGLKIREGQLWEIPVAHLDGHPLIVHRVVGPGAAGWVRVEPVNGRINGYSSVPLRNFEKWHQRGAS